MNAVYTIVILHVIPQSVLIWYSHYIKKYGPLSSRHCCRANAMVIQRRLCCIPVVVRVSGVAQISVKIVDNGPHYSVYYVYNGETNYEDNQRTWTTRR